MTRTRFTLDDLGGTLSWASLLHFVSNLDEHSAYVKKKDGHEVAAWSTRVKTNAILADIYDEIAMLNYFFLAANTPKNSPKPKLPKPYPRPGVDESSSSGTRKFGSKPIPVSQFDDWWDSMDKK